MPPLQELALDARAVALADAVLAEDVEDLEPDGLRVPPPAAHPSERLVRKVPVEAVLVPALNSVQHLRDALLAPPHVLRLVVAVAIPVQELEAGHAEPGVDEAHGVAAGHLLRLPHQLHRQLVASHQRVRGPVGLSIERLGEDVRHVRGLDIHDEAVSVVVPLLLGLDHLQDKNHLRRCSLLGENDLHRILGEGGLHGLFVDLFSSSGPGCAVGQIPVIH
mmetsp:Transcript_7102/g.14362  ORF Transcript_7102/g.14362 Transcript_7102/m.14362 type:complete len:220 (-) Transcript_7102:603-1262(-)